MTRELFWLTLTVILTGLLWVPYILNRCQVRGLTGAMANPSRNDKPHAPWATRLMFAHDNAVENLIIFAPLVLILNSMDYSTKWTVLACAVYFWSRVAHVIVYTLGLPLFRTVAFLVGFAAQAVLAIAIFGWLQTRCVSTKTHHAPGRSARSRQIVAQKDVDADALLIGADRLARTMREQDARRGAGLVARILVDDRVERAADQEPPRMLGQLMGDPDDLAGPPRRLQGVGDAAVAGAAAIDAAQIRMARQQLGRELARELAVVAALDRRQRAKTRVLAAQDLVEAELPFGVIAQRQRPRDHRDSPVTAAQETPHQRRRRPSRRRIVDADIMQAARARRVGHQRHDRDPAGSKLVDRGSHPRMVERDHGDALIGRRQGLQRAGQHIRVEHVDMEDVDEAALPGQPFRRSLDLLGQIRHETVAAGRQHEGKAEALAPGKTRGSNVGAVAELSHGGLDTRDGLGPHALAAVDDAVDGGERHARRPRDVLERGADG